jgi:2,3-bisphosphoglycerate-independent phosphoglycerate mutase
MYRGIARLVGMEVRPPYEDLDDAFSELQRCYEDGDFFFMHVKKTDSYGEDGNFDAKKRVIEEVDRHIPRLREIHRGVLVVTGDHCTPSQMRGHSWHPVPVLIHAETARVDQVRSFHELACGAGSLGCTPMKHLMSLALAHAGRLARFGA